MRIEIKDLKALINPTQDCSNISKLIEGQEEVINLAETVGIKEYIENTSQSKNNESQFNCHECDFQTTGESHINKQHLMKHTHHKNYNCSECDYKAEKKTDLKKHLETTHMNKFKQVEIQCKDCGDCFNDRRVFMQHRKTKYELKVGLCRNFAKGLCRFYDNFC